MGRKAVVGTGDPGWMAEGSGYLALFGANFQFSWYHGSDAGGKQTIQYCG